MAQGGGQAGGMGSSPMGSAPMGGQTQGLGGMGSGMGGPQGGFSVSPQQFNSGQQSLGGFGGGMGGFGGPGPYSPGMQMPMNSTNMATQQNIMGGGMGMPATGDMGGMGGMGQPMQDGFDRMPIQGGMPQTQNTIPGRSDFSGFDGPNNSQGLMQVFRGLGFPMPGGVPPMQNPFSQQGQPQVAQAATAQPQPPVMPQPQVARTPPPQPVQQMREQRRAEQQAQALARQQSRASRRNRRPTPTPTDFSQMGQAGQFGTQGFAQGLQDYLGQNYSGYGYNPTNQTFYSGADRGGQALTLDQALQRGRAAGFQMAQGGITSLRRR